LTAASQHLAKAGVTADQLTRVDVPGRGAGEEGDGAVRVEVEPMIPLLQSGSLFGERLGLQLVDAQNLQVAEVDTLLQLLELADLSSIEVVLVAAGALNRRLATVAKERGSTT